MVRGGHPLLRENLAETDPPFNNADFQPVYARSASAITPSKISSVTVLEIRLHFQAT